MLKLQLGMPPVCCWETVSILSETIYDVDRLIAERQRLTERLAELQSRHEKTRQELQEKTAVVNQLQSSHGWKVLSVYYRLRGKLIPRRLAGIVNEGIVLIRGMWLVSASGLFDKEWYLQQNPDVMRAGISPLRHYIRTGAFEGRDPNPFFDSDWYLSDNPDVATAGINPLWHYLRRGALEQRDPSPQFNTRKYLQMHPEVALAKLNPLAHFFRSPTRVCQYPRRTPQDFRWVILNWWEAKVQVTSGLRLTVASHSQSRRIAPMSPWQLFCILHIDHE